jgi:uncharacterized protein (TIGR02246 family)
MNPPPTSSVPGQAGPENPSHEAQIRALYGQLLDSWNRRDAPGFAALFVDQGHRIGFDGSQMDGPAEIQAELSRIFADHVTARYVSQVRWVRFLTLQAALLCAVVGMVPPRMIDLNPAAIAIQTLSAVFQADQWRIALLQNTPAQYHGRPELAKALTAELRALL